MEWQTVFVTLGSVALGSGITFLTPWLSHQLENRKRKAELPFAFVYHLHIFYGLFKKHITSTNLSGISIARYNIEKDNQLNAQTPFARDQASIECESLIRVSENYQREVESTYRELLESEGTIVKTCGGSEKSFRFRKIQLY